MNQYQQDIADSLYMDGASVIERKRIILPLTISSISSAIKDIIHAISFFTKS